MNINLELGILKISNPNFNTQQLKLPINSTKPKEISHRAIETQHRKKSDSVTSIPQTKVDIAKICQDIVSKLGKHSDSQQECSKVSSGQKIGNCNPLMNFTPPTVLLKGKINSMASSSNAVCSSPKSLQKIEKLKSFQKFLRTSQKQNSLTEKHLNINSNASENYLTFERKTNRIIESPKNEKIVKSPVTSAKKHKTSSHYKLMQEDDLSSQIVSSISTYLKQRLATQSDGIHRNYSTKDSMDVLARKSSKGSNICPKNSHESNKQAKCGEPLKQKPNKIFKYLRNEKDHQIQEFQNSALDSSSKLLDEKNKLKRETFIGSCHNRKSQFENIDCELFTKDSGIDQDCFHLMRLIKNTDSFIDPNKISDISQEYKARELGTLLLKEKQARYFSLDSQKDCRLSNKDLSNISYHDDLLERMVVEEFSHGEKLTISSVRPMAETTLVLASERKVNSKQNQSFNTERNRVTAHNVYDKSLSLSLLNDYSFLTLHRQDSELA